MDQHQRPLPLPDVSEQILAVPGLVADEVEHVVADLEGGAEIEAETRDGVQRHRAGRADQRSDPERPHRRVPARLLSDELEIVAGLEVHDVVRPPAEFGGLALDRAGEHVNELVGHSLGQPGTERSAVPQRFHGEHGQGVPHVDGDRRAVRAMQRRLPAPLQAAVLDVIVDEERVVGQLDGDRGTQRLVDRPAEGLAGGQQQGRADALSGPGRIVPHEVVEVPAGCPAAQVTLHGVAGETRVLAEHRLDVGWPGGSSHGRPFPARTRRRTGRATSGSPRARMWPWYTPGATWPRAISTVADVLALGPIVSTAGWKRAAEAGTVRPSWEARSVRRGSADAGCAVVLCIHTVAVARTPAAP